MLTLPAGPVLRDIHMPPPASWWPLAPGWWIVLALVCAAAALLAWTGHRRRLPRRRWHAARRELQQLHARHGDDAAAYAAGVSQLLRRAARVRDPTLASLHGPAWHAAMRSLAGGQVAMQPLEALDGAMYRRDAVLDAAAATAAARAWLRQVLLHGGARA